MVEINSEMFIYYTRLKDFLVKTEKRCEIKYLYKDFLNFF